jgi:predicted HTH domain antitoxin
MALHIPEDLLKAANLDERGLLIELACHLFDKDRLPLAQAARLAGLSRGEFEDELHDRNIPIYRYTLEDYEQDMQAIAKMNNPKP